MDEQNLNTNEPVQPEQKHVPTAEEIARAEAAAVAALRQKETESGKPDFVPYVDDVPEEAPAPKPVAKPAAAKSDAPAEAIASEDDDEEEYVPTEWERRIAAIPEDKWTLYQTIAGALLGIAAISILFLGQELATYALLIAVLLALFLPNYLERSWRRKMPRLRTAMLIGMVAALVIAGLVIGIRTGFKFRADS